MAVGGCQNLNLMSSSDDCNFEVMVNNALYSSINIYHFTPSISHDRMRLSIIQRPETTSLKENLITKIVSTCNQDVWVEVIDSYSCFLVASLADVVSVIVNR